MESAPVADKINKRLGHIAGLRAGQNYRIWIEERELLKWFVRYVYDKAVIRKDEEMQDIAREFLKYFHKYQQTE